MIFCQTIKRVFRATWIVWVRQFRAASLDFPGIAMVPDRREILDWFHLIENLHKVGGSLNRLSAAKTLLWRGRVEEPFAQLGRVLWNRLLSKLTLGSMWPSSSVRSECMMVSETNIVPSPILSSNRSPSLTSIPIDRYWGHLQPRFCNPVVTLMQFHPMQSNFHKPHRNEQNSGLRHRWLLDFFLSFATKLINVGQDWDF